MTDPQHKKISKFLSLVLRHKPEIMDLKLDENGWASVAELIINGRKHFRELDIDLLKDVVANNDKQRFIFNGNQSKIRASQGHSIPVDLALAAEEPPAYLYHGTIEKFIPLIKEAGLKKMGRQYVHLSRDIATAQKVGSRRGKPVVLTIWSQKMFKDGIRFYLSENEVWLCDEVPSKYIEFNDHE